MSQADAEKTASAINRVIQALNELDKRVKEIESRAETETKHRISIKQEP